MSDTNYQSEHFKRLELVLSLQMLPSYDLYEYLQNISTNQVFGRSVYTPLTQGTPASIK